MRARTRARARARRRELLKLLDQTIRSSREHPRWQTLCGISLLFRTRCVTSKIRYTEKIGAFCVCSLARRRSVLATTWKATLIRNARRSGVVVRIQSGTICTGAGPNFDRGCWDASMSRCRWVRHSRAFCDIYWHARKLQTWRILYFYRLCW